MFRWNTKYVERTQRTSSLGQKRVSCGELKNNKKKKKKRRKKQTHHVRGGFQGEPRANADGKHVTARHDDHPSPPRLDQKYTIIIYNRSGGRFTEFQARPLHRRQERTHFGRNSRLLTTSQSATSMLLRYKIVFFISHAVRKKSFRSVFYTHVKWLNFFADDNVVEFYFISREQNKNRLLYVKT